MTKTQYVLGAALYALAVATLIIGADGVGPSEEASGVVVVVVVALVVLGIASVVGAHYAGERQSEREVREQRERDAQRSDDFVRRHRERAT